MTRKRLIQCVPWVFLVVAIATSVAREFAWRGRQSTVACVEQHLRQVSAASSEAEEQAALGRLMEWILSRDLMIGLSARDVETGQEVDYVTVRDMASAHIVFELGVDTDGDYEPDHSYNIVLKNPANVCLLMKE